MKAQSGFVIAIIGMAFIGMLLFTFGAFILNNIHTSNETINKTNNSIYTYANNVTGDSLEKKQQMAKDPKIAPDDLTIS